HVNSLVSLPRETTRKQVFGTNEGGLSANPADVIGGRRLVVFALPRMERRYIVTTSVWSNEQLEDVLIEYVVNCTVSKGKGTVAPISIDIGVQFHHTPELAQNIVPRSRGGTSLYAHASPTVGISSSPRSPIGCVANCSPTNTQAACFLG